MKKLIIIALIAVSGIAGAATLSMQNKEDVKEIKLPIDNSIHQKCAKVATWDKNSSLNAFDTRLKNKLKYLSKSLFYATYKK
ncbi:MAG: hypothetical protein H7263_08530, partial [Candidatus Sericytochromatia bacterium]|nr:hypothetical protein [Candidatus Sericytochromatia bacterium]